jgi:very-short-patch-repair endonuclease
MKGYSTLSRDRAKSLRRSSTDAELRLWRLLRARRILPHKFRRQHPVGAYIVDFVCVEKMLVIEVDGSQHMDEAEYDARRTAALEQLGYCVLRFWDNDVLLKPRSVLESIYAALGCPSPGPSP